MAVTETTNQPTKATVAPQGAKGAPKAGTSAEKATPKQKAPKSPKAANKAKAGKKAAKPKKTASSKPASKEGRAGTKSAKVLDLIRRPNGATLKEIMKATGWQAHSVRGFISGALGKKMGLRVEAAKREDGERAYQVK